MSGHPQALKGSGSSCHLTFLERRHFDEAEGQSLLDEADLKICLEIWLEMCWKCLGHVGREWYFRFPKTNYSKL